MLFLWYPTSLELQCTPISKRFRRQHAGRPVLYTGVPFHKNKSWLDEENSVCSNPRFSGPPPNPTGAQLQLDPEALLNPTEDTCVSARCLCGTQNELNKKKNNFLVFWQNWKWCLYAFIRHSEVWGSPGRWVFAKKTHNNLEAFFCM